MARPKRSLSSLLDDEKPSAVESTDQTAVTAPTPVESRPEAPLAVVQAMYESAPPKPAEAVTEPIVGAVVGVKAPEAPAAAIPSVRAQSATPAKLPALEAPTPRSATVRQIKPAPEPQHEHVPLYLELTRKEARFRQDQLNALTTLTRQLNRRRASTGERITDNTLIRVAVDMMLEVAESLNGATETDLLAAVRTRLK